MKVKIYKPLWFLTTTLISIFSICTIRIFDGYNWPFYAVTLNAVISLAGLIFHLHVRKGAQNRFPVRVVRIALFLNSLAVFGMLGLSLFILTSQYHNPLASDGKVSSVTELQEMAAHKDRDVFLGETDKLYIYYPDYEEISFASRVRPSKADEGIILCVAAAFQRDYELSFDHDNIVGWHSSNGELEMGYPEDNLGGFTWTDGEASIWDTDEAEKAIKTAAAAGGEGYQQFVVLHDGERGTHTTREFRCYRVLAILDGRACIIDSQTQMHYDEFISALEKLGVRDALYCDMGSGWNYSWYRDENGKAVDIIGTPWPFSHNWLVFRKNGK